MLLNNKIVQDNSAKRARGAIITLEGKSKGRLWKTKSFKYKP